MIHSTKIWKKIIDKIISIEEASVTKYQFSFMSGLSTLEPLCCVKQLVEKYREKKKMLCMLYIEL